MFAIRVEFAIAVCFYILAIFHLIEGADDLYAILGVSRKATQVEIKRAYRQKARDTHPDKNPGLDPDEAANNFRAVADAYETLSDVSLRQNYDRSGTTSQDKTNARRRQQGQQSSNGWFWNFGGFQGQHRQQQRPAGHHRHLYDRHFRPAIKDAQSRVLSVTSMNHLRFVALDENDMLDRYVLVAIYDGSMKGCESTLNYQLLYPWPFAGYSREGGDNAGIWWEDVLLAVKIDINDNTLESEDIMKHFNISFNKEDAIKNGRKFMSGCPAISFLPRGGTIDNVEVTQSISTHEEFQKFVWSVLKMKVTFWNRTPHTVKSWWLDGNRGIAQKDLLPDARATQTTFLTHSFYFRVSWVPGNVLTNESALLWYTATMADDRKVIEINKGCFDHHGDCKRWQREGFCDTKKDTWYVQQNPKWRNWVIENCYVSCKVGCGADKQAKPAASLKKPPPVFGGYNNDL